MGKRTLAFCMMVCMFFTMLPMTVKAGTSTQDIYTNNGESAFAYESTGECTIPIGHYVYGSVGDTYTLTNAVRFLLISNVEVAITGGSFEDYVIVGSGSIVLGDSSITPTSSAAEIAYTNNAKEVVDAFLSAAEEDCYDLIIGDVREFEGEFANVTLLNGNAQLTIPDDAELIVLNTLNVNAASSLAGGGTLRLNRAATVTGLDLYDSTGAPLNSLGDEREWYCFGLVEDRWTLQDDGGELPSSGEIRLELLDVGETGYTASDFQYSVGGGNLQSFLYDVETPVSANGDISAAGNVTVTLNKHAPDDPFWGFGYTFDGQLWYNTVDLLRNGDSFDNATNTLTIVREGTEGVRIDACINDPQNNLYVESESASVSESAGYDNAYVNNGELTITNGSTLEIYGELRLENGILSIDSGTALTVYGDLRLENGTLTVNGDLTVNGLLVMDNNNEVTNTVNGIDFYENAEAVNTLENTDGAYTFSESEAFIFDTLYGKWVRHHDNDGGGNGGGNDGHEAVNEEAQINYGALKAFMENTWGVAEDENVETMKTALIDMLWDMLIHEWRGESIYTNRDGFAAMVTVGNEIAGTDTISNQAVDYHSLTIAIPVPDAEEITVTSKLYAIPTDYIVLEHTSDKAKMLWNYTSEEALVFDDTEPENFRCIGARISGSDKCSNVCFLQMEGGILTGYLKTVQIFDPDYQGVKFDKTENVTAAQWGYFHHPYVDFGNTTMENPEEISMFYGYEKLVLNNPSVVGTAGVGLTINEVSVVNGKGIPANVITYNNTDGSVTFNTDYYTEVPLQVEYTLEDSINRTAYVTVKRTGIHINGWMRSGDRGDNSTERVLHGTQLGGEFNWGTDRYVVYATYYADGKVAAGCTASLYAKVTYADGRTETKTISGNMVSGGDEYWVDSFDFQIYKGTNEGAPTKVEVIAYVVTAQDTGCSSAFTGDWNKPSER